MTSADGDPPPPPTHELTTPDDRVLRYCLYGPPDGTPAIFHGGSPSTRWKHPDLATAMARSGLRALVFEAVAEHRKLAAAAGAGALLRETGWIKVFRSARGRDQGLAEAEEAHRFGVNYTTLDRGRLLELEPHLGEAAIGGVHFTDPLTTSDPSDPRPGLWPKAG